ncbi:TGS domain-containing protein, partial [Acinetobacter baumannii]
MKLAGAKVNGKIVPLSTPLQNGDVVEIDTRNGSTPSLDWLEFVKSAHARSKLRGHFRKLNRISDVARGRSYVEKELRA